MRHTESILFRRIVTAGVIFTMAIVIALAPGHVDAQKSSAKKKSGKSSAAKTTVAKSKEGKATTVC